MVAGLVLWMEKVCWSWLVGEDSPDPSLEVEAEVEDWLFCGWACWFAAVVAIERIGPAVVMGRMGPSAQRDNKSSNRRGEGSI